MGATPEQALTPTNGVLNDQIETFAGPGAIASDVRAEVDTQITTAKRYPRNLHAFTKQALEMATFNEEIASGCFYALPRDGKTVDGPSARLAEIILSAWGNVRSEAKVVDIGETMITAEAMTWDLEKNVAIRVQVKRRITNKYGKRFSDDMIVVTGNAACSIALRNSVFKVIPNVFTQSIYEAARKTAIGNAETLVNKRAALIEYFGKMGVQAERVFRVVGKEHIEDIGLDELATLRGLATAIKDGDTSVDEAFPLPPSENGNGQSKPAAGVSALKDKITNQPGVDQPTNDAAAGGEAGTEVAASETAEKKTRKKSDAPAEEVPTQPMSVARVVNVVTTLQKKHSMSADDLATQFLPEGKTLFSQLTEAEADEVLPSLEEMLATREAA